MLDIIQSNCVRTLRRELTGFFAPASVFEPQQVLVPSHGVGVWLQQGMADCNGVASLVQTDFIGTYQWKLYAQILRQLDRELYRNLGDEVPLAAQAIQGRIFAYLIAIHEDEGANPQAARALEFLFAKLGDTQSAMGIRRQLWGMAAQIARVFADYVVYRPEWLEKWGRGEFIGLGEHFASEAGCVGDGPAAGEAGLLPLWRQKDAIAIEQWQRQVWRDLFADTFARRERLRQLFWQALEQHEKASYFRRDLPRQLAVFAPVKLPPGELDFLVRLSRYSQIRVLHYNPTPEYWADVVDQRWLAEARLRWPKLAAMRDSQHTLLTSFGKQARDVFAQLVELSDGQYGDWQDAFAEDGRTDDAGSLLEQVKRGVVALQDPPDHSLVWRPGDDSLRVHACHSAMRQLEVLREEILQWLAADPRRKPADVLVLMPDLEAMAPLIRAVFQSGAEAHELPVDITGMVSPDAQVLWDGLAQAYRLLQGRFGVDAFVDYLALPPVSRAYGLDRLDVQRVSALLQAAGFYRGFDGAHLAVHLAKDDRDDRCTLRHALDRLVLGMAMPVEAEFAGRVASAQVGRGDFERIAALERVYRDLQELADLLDAVARADLPRGDGADPAAGALPNDVRAWLQTLRAQLERRFGGERTTAAWHEVQQLLDGLEKGLHSDAPDVAVRLPLLLLLDEISNRLRHQPPGAVPRGQVSFARLGTLRPLPYGLVVLLDMAVVRFPQRDVPSSFDLMQVTRGQRFDRSRQQDDQGAFLDALLLAQEACWLFYTAYESGQPERLQPAGPVQKLLEFMGRKLAPLDALSALPLDLRAQQDLVARCLIVAHRQLPFEPDNFLPASALHEQGRRPMMGSGLWFEVARTLHAGRAPVPWFEAGLLPAPSHSGQPVPLARLIGDVQQPNRPFLRQARIRRLDEVSGLDAHEPLSLDALQLYQLRAQFVQKGPLPAVWLKTRMPAGQLAPVYAEWVRQQHEAFAARLQSWARKHGKTAVDPCTRRTLHVAGVALLIDVPEPLDTPVWLRWSPSRASDKHLLKGWLQHLGWQVLRGDAQGGTTVVVGSDETVSFAPVSAQEARQQLAHWLAFWQLTLTEPVALPAALLTKHAKALKKDADAAAGSTWRANKTLIDQWLGKKNYDHGPAPSDDEACAQHPDWQLILRGQDAKQALEDAVEQHGARLYGPMLAHHTVLAEGATAQGEAP